MGIRILFYHTRMFADFAPMLHKLASRCMLHSMNSVCKSMPKFTIMLILKQTYSLNSNKKISVIKLWIVQLILPTFHTRFTRTKLAAVALVFDYILVMHIT